MNPTLIMWSVLVAVIIAAGTSRDVCLSCIHVAKSIPWPFHRLAIIVWVRWLWALSTEAERQAIYVAIEMAWRAGRR